MQRTGEGGGQWKIFSGGPEVHKADELEREQVDCVCGLMPKGIH